jgi:D-inositol-3-phosphate glycosyltransferase
MLKIAMLSVHSSPIGELGAEDTGGMSVYVRELATELGRRGHRVDIFTRLNDSVNEPVVELSNRVRVIHLRAGINAHVPKQFLHRHLAGFSRDLENYRAAKDLCYDLIHSHYWLSGLVGEGLKQSWKVPHILMFHTLGALKDQTGQEEREPGFRLAAERGLVGACDHVLAPTPQERRHLMQYYDAPAEKITVIPCGVNLHRFLPTNKTLARRRLGIAADRPNLLFVGRFARLKGIERLLAAVALLHEHPRPRLLVIGGNGRNAPEYRNLKSLSEDLGIQESVVFPGRIPQERLPAYYSAADLLVVPSSYESFGLVALEALACGTPVVATRVGAMPGILREGINGCLVPDGSPASVALGIRRTLKQCGGFSSERMRASVMQYGWHHVASAMLEFYRAAIRSYSDSPPLHENQAFQGWFARGSRRVESLALLRGCGREITANPEAATHQA